MIGFVNYFLFFANDKEKNTIGFVHYFLFFLLIWLCAIAVRAYFDDRGE